MENRLNRTSRWQSHLGNVVTVEGMSDDHLANLIQYMENYKYPMFMREGLLKEVKRRGLSNKYLERSPIPYKDGKGNWLVWDYEKHGPVSVGSYIKK